MPTVKRRWRGRSRRLLPHKLDDLAAVAMGAWRWNIGEKINEMVRRYSTVAAVLCTVSRPHRTQFEVPYLPHSREPTLRPLHTTSRSVSSTQQAYLP